MRNIPSAFWIDVKSKIRKSSLHPDLSTVEGILENAAACASPPVVTFIVYDLPNRDCYALASNGEICCHYGEDVGRTKCLMNEQGSSKGFYKEFPGENCKDGLREYKETYIDPFADVVSQYTDRVPVVLIIEPDSLGNMVTNMADSRPNSFRGCTNETKVSYEEGIAYAVNKFAPTGATMYVDAAHGGWLGWANPGPGEDKAARFANIIKGLGIQSKIRGFATNVAGYQALGTVLCPAPGYCRGGNSNHECCQDDPCKLQDEWNWGHNELNYIDVVWDRMKSTMPGFDPKFIIDSGRNGNPGTRRAKCQNWCNVRGAGIGHAPTTNTADVRIDAYFWLKTPGESDGCTEDLPEGGKCPRFDAQCADQDALGSMVGEPRAPEAGIWFHYQIAQLAENADMGDVSIFQDTQKCDTPTSARPTPRPTPMPTVMPSVPPLTPEPTPDSCDDAAGTDTPWGLSCTDLRRHCATIDVQRWCPKSCGACPTPLPTPRPTQPPQTTCDGYVCGFGWLAKPRMASNACSSPECTVQDCCLMMPPPSPSPGSAEEARQLYNMLPSEWQSMIMNLMRLVKSSEY
jgi:cellulose 1,4-beta-cellobiosidase